MADGALEFKDVNSIADPLLAFKWICTLVPTIGGVTIPKTYVEGVDIPFPEIQQKDGVFLGGTYFYLPGYENFSAFNIKLYEDVNLRSLKFLTKWRHAIRQPDTGLYYLPDNYKFDMAFALYDQTNAAIAELKLFGCWPTSLGSLPLGQESDRVILQQNLSCDGLEIEFRK